MYLMSRRVCGLALVPLVLITFVSCGGKTPAAQTPVPTPSANPGPAPTPSATSEVVSKSCQRIGYGTNALKCPMESSGFQNDVDDAIRTLQQERPDIFNGNYIQSLGAYYVGIIKILDRKGICAGFDGEELAVKTDNTFNEQFDIETATGLVRFGPVSYRSTCYPASFPLPPGPPIPPPAGCSLPSSEAIACGQDGSVGKYYDDVVAAINQVIDQHPDWFDFGDTRAGGPYIKDLEAYANAVATAITPKGYCARWDGKELQVKRGSNTFNEQYAITLSLTHVRRDPNMYRSSCFPAAF
jgi:hypothetical protein